MRFGLFGGAFDPLHNEHVEILELAHKMLKTDAIILVPSHNPPHKDKRLAPFAKRLEMLNEYFADKSHVIIDDIESVRDISDNYACEIIPVIKEKYGGSFVYIIGGDSLADIETWRNPKDIIANTPIVAIARPGFGDLHKKARELNAQYGGKVSVIEYSGEGVSSSEIKAKIETGITQNVPVPNQVLEYIIKNGLYTEHKDIVYKLKKNISNELFEHCARTAIFASHYAGMLRLGFRKVFLAALLHDCAKEMKPLKSEYPTKSSKVIHQYDGKTVAQSEYGIDDADILDAIEYHTTGRPDMTPLGKLIYVADKLEPSRDFLGINDIRGLLKIDFQYGFLKLLERSVAYISGKGLPIDKLTMATYNYYRNQSRAKK